MKFLHHLHNFDIRAQDLEVKMIHKNIRKKILAIMIPSHLSSIILSIATSLTFHFNGHYFGLDFALPLGYSFLLFYMTLWIEQFSFAVLALQNRFELLNRNLKFTFECGQINNIEVINLYSTQSKKNTAKLISQLYSQLCDGIELVNEAFTLQLIPFVIYHLTVNLFTIYGLIREVALNSSVIWAAISLNLGWIITTTFLLSLALYSAEKTQKNARETPSIIGYILKMEKFKAPEDILKTFLLEVQYRNISFHNELFHVEWKLMLQVS